MPKGNGLSVWQMVMAFQRGGDPMLQFRSGFSSLSPMVIDWSSLVPSFTCLGLHFYLSKMGTVVATSSKRAKTKV